MNRIFSIMVIAFLIFIVVSANAEPLSIPPKHKRPPEQTYLTFPEWYLVHSPAEYAVFVKNNPPSDFPFFGHVRQFWQSYQVVWEATRDRYPVNLGYHVMVSVIGISTTIEYGLKSFYETFIGRLSLLTRSDAMTVEDKLAAEVAQDYVDFIRVDPWYKYDFTKRLIEVWTNTGLWGPDLLRKWERKYALTTEYAAKAIYAWIIGKATQAGYEAPIHVTAAIVSKAPIEKISKTGQIEIIQKDTAGKSAVVLLPRYQAFTTEARRLANRGVEFIEIAGNRGEILVSVIALQTWSPDSPLHSVLLRQPILTQPDKVRYLLTVPIAKLSADLRELLSNNIELEHIYDF